VEHVLRNPGLFSSDFIPAEVSSFPLIPENIDPPDHRRYRRLLDPLFGPKPMRRLEPEITRRANELIDRFVARGECDFAQEFAVPLPCGVFLDLVGLPAGELDVFLGLKEEILRGRLGDEQRARAVATGNGELGGCPVNQGDYVVLLLGSANTDESAHERPDVVDFDRPALRHLGFGGGIHRCIGSHLARLELQISLREWHRRIPVYRVPEDVELEFMPLLRQVEHLPLVFDERAA
jgi:cytochrome P450